MRNQFVRTVENLFKKDKKLFLLLGDIGVYGFRNIFKSTIIIMAFNEVYSKKLDSEGNPILVDGDFVMELISSIEVPDIVMEPTNIVTVDLNNKESINELILKLQNLNK